MNYSFHPEAEREFSHAIDYYESCKTGLGFEFALEVRAAIDRILAHPKAWPVLEGEVRRSQVFRFPYAVLYAEANAGVYILAIMHLHREPGYWTRRSD